MKNRRKIKGLYFDGKRINTPSHFTYFIFGLNEIRKILIDCKFCVHKSIDWNIEKVALNVKKIILRIKHYKKKEQIK